MYKRSSFTQSAANLTSEYSFGVTPSGLGDYAPNGTHALLHHQLVLSGLDSGGGTITARWKVTRNSVAYYGPSESVTYQPGDTTLVVDLRDVLYISGDSLELLLTSDNANDTAVDIAVEQINVQQVNVGAISESEAAADNVEANIPKLNAYVSGCAQAAHYTEARAALLDNLSNLDAAISAILSDTMTKPQGRATTYKEAIAQLYQRFFGPAKKGDLLIVYDDDEETVLTSQDVYVTSDGTEVLGKAT